MKKIIYLDIVSSIKKIRPAERKIFFDILPSRNYQVFTLLNEPIKENDKINNNIIQIDCSSKINMGLYKNIYNSVNILLKENEINYIVIRNKVWLGLIVLFLKNIGKTKTIFIRAFPTELLSIHNANKYFIIRKWLSIIKNKILLFITDVVMKKFDIIFARSKKFAEQLSRRVNRMVFPLPMGFDTNWTVNKNTRSRLIKELNPKGNIIIGYVGAIDEGRNIDFILRIYKGIFALNNESINGLIITENPPSLKNHTKNLIIKYGLQDKLKVVGPYNYEEIPTLLSIMTATISPIPPIPPYIVSSPTKTVESIGMGIPVIGNKEIKDQEFVINGSGCGISTNYDISNFVKGVEKVILNTDKNKLHKNGISFIAKCRTYEIITDQFESVINN